MSAKLRLFRLVLVRHGDSGPSRSDVELSEIGREQARSLRERLMRSGELRGARSLVASDLERSVQTAEIIAAAVGAVGLPVTSDRRLREMSLDETGPPETWHEFETRARSALRSHVEIATSSTVVAVCHTGVIEASFIEFAGLAVRSQRFAMRPRDTSLTTWVGAKLDDGPFHWRLENYNDAAHLWTDGELCHGDEDYDVLASGHEPFWAEVEGREP